MNYIIGTSALLLWLHAKLRSSLSKKKENLASGDEREKAQKQRRMRNSRETSMHGMSENYASNQR